jgi:phosphonoacetate hydrolase
MGVQSLPTDITVNGRTYRWMEAPLVVVCIDGSQYEYITAAVAAGAAPYLGRRHGHLFHGRLRHAELHQSQ